MKGEEERGKEGERGEEGREGGEREKAVGVLAAVTAPSRRGDAGQANTDDSSAAASSPTRAVIIDRSSPGGSADHVIGEAKSMARDIADGRWLGEK